MSKRVLSAAEATAILNSTGLLENVCVGGCIAGNLIGPTANTLWEVLR